MTIRTIIKLLNELDADYSIVFEGKRYSTFPYNDENPCIPIAREIDLTNATIEVLRTTQMTTARMNEMLDNFQKDLEENPIEKLEQPWSGSNQAGKKNPLAPMKVRTKGTRKKSTGHAHNKDRWRELDSSMKTLITALTVDETIELPVPEGEDPRAYQNAISYRASQLLGRGNEFYRTHLKNRTVFLKRLK